jgi:hypothetical protein
MYYICFMSTKSICVEKMIAFVVFFCVASFAFSQSLSPQVTSTAGTSFANGANQLDWTLGESVTSSLSANNQLVTQVFHQSNLTITAIDKLDNKIGITIFPNPTLDIIQIKFEKVNENNVLELYSVDGKLLLTKNASTDIQLQLDLSAYNSGTYILKIKNKKVQLRSYQVIKLN